MKFNILYIFIFVFFTLVLFCILGNSTTREGLTNEPNQNVETAENNETTFNTVGLAKPATTTTYDNYNHYNGDSLPTTFYGPDGGKITINKLTKTMYVTDSSGKTTRYIKPQNNESKKYYYWQSTNKFF